MKSFNSLWGELEQTSASPRVDSRTSELLQAGVHTIGKKVVEEAAEVWMAAEYQSNEELAEEIAQLIYHLQVIALARGLTLPQIEEKL
jgi:phosphoribosyl-ATP pyrophosphohydrolase